MGKSPFIDAIEALEEIRAFCERREKAYEGWGSTPISAEYDLKHIRQKVDEAIKELMPNQPGDSGGVEKDKKDPSNKYKGTFD
tara:strand:+ start:37 stop:285 length:249 start_codon:yes stop_codon:yes gene_type:complete